MNSKIINIVCLLFLFLSFTACAQPQGTPNKNDSSGTAEKSLPQANVINTSLQQTITVNIPKLPAGAIPLEMVKIPAGKFMMGRSQSELDALDKEYPELNGLFYNEGPQHQVTITKPFYMGKYEVTQAQWQAIMGSNPSNWNGNNRPVEQVSWNDCQTFIQKLNQMGQGMFRLPTEAEWEYACCAGTHTAFYWGEDKSYKQIMQYAWFNSNSGNQTNNVGMRLSNPWGLFDMSGNVWEWCQDWYGSYSSNIQTDPTGPSTGPFPVDRGGGWGDEARRCRSTDRGYASPDGSSPDIRHSDLGFRLVRSYP